MNTRKMNKKGLVMLALYSTAAIGIAGSVVGTYAWYSYNNVAFASFEGASIANSRNLDIGIYSDSEISAFEDGGDCEGLLDKDTTTIAGVNIYWGHEALPADVIEAYLDEMGYGGGTSDSPLKPVTSGTFANEATSGAISLKEAPGLSTLNEDHIAVDEEASLSHYLALPLIFRIAEVEGETFGNAKNQDIFLDNIDIAKISGEDEFKKALRFSFEDAAVDNDQIILNPAVASDGEIETGGILNLDGDRFYDFNASMKEIVYGDIEGDITYGDRIGASEGPNGGACIDDSELTTFNANHRKNVKKASYTAKKANYVGYTQYYDDPASEALCNTGNKGYAQVNMMMWIEGWDPACIDLNANTAFTMSLSFSIED